MSTCTFFGHRDAPERIYEEIKSAVITLIEQKNVYNFYVGNNGNFDFYVCEILKELSNIYEIKYSVVLSNFPKDEIENSIMPDGIEYKLPRFKIAYRNDWMIKKSDYIITYVIHSWGGAAKFKELAIKRNKIVIEIGD